MNRLWEAFLERILRRGLPDYQVSGQEVSPYWHPEDGSASELRPDITIRDRSDQNNIVALLDAKWKVPNNDRPSSTDLQQLYTYAHFHETSTVGLLYPRTGASSQVQGNFGPGPLPSGGTRCFVGFIPLPDQNEPSNDWGTAIAEVMSKWLSLPTI